MRKKVSCDVTGKQKRKGAEASSWHYIAKI